MMDKIVKKPQRPFRIAMLLAMGAVCLAIYSVAMHGPFIFDDEPNILLNEHVRLKTISVETLTDAAFHGPMKYRRPLAYISFAANYYFGGYETWHYRLVNICIHLATALFLYLLFRQTVSFSSVGRRTESSDLLVDAAVDSNRGAISPSLEKRGSDFWVPFWAAVIWAVHPVQIQSVTYIVQRMNSLSAFFSVLCLWLYVNGRNHQQSERPDRRSLYPQGNPGSLVRRRSTLFFAGALASGMMAIASKENAATLPFFVLLYEWFFFQNLSWAWLKKKLPLLGVLLLFGAIVVVVFLGTKPWESVLRLYGIRDYTLLERVMTQWRVVVFYISLLLFPHPARLNLDHDFSISHSLVDPLTTLFALAFILGLFFLAIIFAKKERLWSFAVVWFLGNLAIESSVIGLELVFEHRTYLPFMFLIFAAVSGLWRVAGQRLAVVFALCSLAVVVLSVWTYQRNLIWQSKLSLWGDCVTKSPHKPRSNNTYGNVLAEEGRLKESLEYYHRAAESDPGSADAFYNMGVTLAELGESAQAMAAYLRALEIEPDNPEVHTNLGIELVRTGKTQQGIAHFLLAIKRKPGLMNAHLNLGLALMSQGNPDAALAAYRDALAIEPDNPSINTAMGNVFFNRGDIREAASYYAKVIRQAPRHADAYNGLGGVLVRMGEVAKAVVMFEEAVKLDPGLESARNNLEAARNILRTDGDD